MSQQGHRACNSLILDGCPGKGKQDQTTPFLTRYHVTLKKTGAFRLKCRQEFPPVSSQYKRTLYCLYTHVHTYVLHHSHFLSHCHTHFIPSSFHFTIVRTADLAMCPPPTHTQTLHIPKSHSTTATSSKDLFTQSLPSGRQQ